MADTFKKLYQGQVPNSATTLYTVPGSTSAIIKHMRMVNTTGSDVTIQLWRDGSADSNMILPVTTILAGGWAEWDGSMAMNTGETIVGQAGAATSITMTIDGDEIT